jgi:hypothetical protein
MVCDILEMVKSSGRGIQDWASSATNGKNTLGCCFSLGSTMISWLSKKQTSEALGSMKVKYMVASIGVVSPFGFASCLQVYLIKSWIPR